MSEPRTRTFYGARFPGGKLEYTVPDGCDLHPCRGCRHYHPDDAPHRGSPSDWNPEMINLVPHRPVGHEIDAFQRDLDALAKVMPWADAAAAAVYRRDPLTRFAWLSPPGLDHEEDQTLFVGPPGTVVELRCGVCLRVTAERTGIAHAPKQIQQSGVVLLLGFTGILAEVIRRPGAQTAEEFLAHGARVVARLEREKKADVIQRAKAQKSEVSNHG